MSTRFTQSHEWIRTNDQKIATLGITQHAQAQVGEVVYIELPRIGAEVQAGEAIVVMESTKAAIDIYSPIAGTIVAVNEALREQPQLVNSAPEQEGWLIQIALAEPAQLDKFLDLSSYSQLVPA
jgi:glycine cleavage system H protein